MKLRRQVIDTLKRAARVTPRPLRVVVGKRRLDMKSRRLYHKYRRYTMTYERRYLKTLSLVFSRRSVLGCVVECGVWRGGMIAGMAELLGPDRQYFLFDSFEGLPAGQEIDGPKLLAYQAAVDSPTYLNNCKASQLEADAVMRISGVPSYSLHKGWFDDTLPKFMPPCPIAFLRLDGDLYSSMLTCLTNLWPHLAPNGVAIIDDYNIWDGCTRAVHKFLGDNSKGAEIPKLRQYEDEVYFLSR